MIQIAVLGYGTVGSGVAEVIWTNQELINKRAGEDINIKYVLDLRNFPGDRVESVLTHDFEQIINDPEIKIVVEVMGGLKPAYDFTKRCLLAGKSVCTSNKELVARHGAELIEIAGKNDVNYFFEASVGGGIPIIRPLNSSLTADDITVITGILNGTTNYVLTKMTYEGTDFDSALKDAQDNGFAERNPEADVEGYDACRKIAILTSLISGRQVDFEDIYTEGISKITPEDIAYAKKTGRAVKLLAMTKKRGGRYYAIVAPFLLGADHPLYSVNGVFNAIFVVGNMLGDAMFYGSGAGKLPTASAVVGDVVDAARHLGKHVNVLWSREKLELEDIGQVQKRRFVRIKGDACTDAGAVRDLFGDVEVVDAGIAGEFGFITEKMTEAKYAELASKATGIIHMIRVEE